MWYAIYTKSGREDEVAFRLGNAGVNVLNAKIKSEGFRRNRLVESVEPLFPCYIFAEFDKDKYSHMIAYTRGVRYIVGKQNPVVVYEDIIRSIKENMAENGFVIIKPGKFSRGDRVVIKEGPFKNFHGIFEKELKGAERVMILLETISCRVEIDGHQIEVM